MIDRSTKLRWRRRVRQRKRQVEDISYQAEEQLEQHFFKRLSRLVQVRRFVASWLLLLVLLIIGVVTQTRGLSSYYQTDQPIPGGTYTEGILGNFTNANPMYATGSADSAVSRLLFASLMKYDKQNKLVGDLAQDIKLDDTRLVYTVTLRSDIKWHDGQPVTADDVVFTYKTIQNPDAKSPLRNSRRDVKVKALDAKTVTFTLPNQLSAFPHSLTNGIVPQHHLKDIEPAQLRSVSFNTFRPTGSGPFKWETIEVKGITPETRQEQIGLLPYSDYHDGKPKLSRFIIRTFRSEESLIESFTNNELNAVVGLESVPDNIPNGSLLQEYNIPLTGQTMVFFKTTQPPFDDVNVRRALVQSIDTSSILQGLGYPVKASREPFLPIHIGYRKDIPQLEHDITQAKKWLDEAGWVLGADGIRVKDKQPLTFRLYTQSNSEYAFVSQQLQSQWREIGVDVQVILQESTDLQTTVAQHTYDALLYGISLGMDPDVFAYWHSSQAAPRSGGWLNLSEYQSKTADDALEAGRTRHDATLRAVKYQPFLEAWRSDAPALALYQPRFLYVARNEIFNFEPTTFNSAVDRYSNVHNWMIREGKVSKLSVPVGDVTP